MEDIRSNAYLYGRELFGDDETVLAYYRRKKMAAAMLLKRLLSEDLWKRDTLRINRVYKAIDWCQARIDEIEAGLRSRSEHIVSE